MHPTFDRSLQSGLHKSVAKAFTAVLSTIIALSLPVQAHPFEELRGLKRFDMTEAPASQSRMEIKNVFIGDNALASAIALDEKGGEIHNVTGGARSERARFSFFQPYLDSRLEQVVELGFNKSNGFIDQLSSTYKIKSAYLDISPIRQKVRQAAIDKYGPPLSMTEVRSIAEQKKGDVDLRRFIPKLSPEDGVKEQVLSYFAKRNISKDAKFSADQDGHALMHSGFDRCLIWQQNDFREILTFCAFAPKAANASNRGVELNLQNFLVAEQVAQRKTLEKQRPTLSIKL